MTKINPEIVEKAISDYRTDGRELMIKLGKKFGFDINENDEYQQLISRSNNNIPRKGQLTERWNYRFHGTECEFYNKKHQQSVEVVLTNPPVFGVIDVWFLMKYMESTELYKECVEGIEWTELKPVVEDLYSSGNVVEIKK